MARVTMSVSDGLKKRMSKAKRHVNWSEIAQAAFERKLGELAQQKEIKKMSDVIERLRASKLESDSETEKQGRNDGREWAKRTATAVDLERLANAHRVISDQDWHRMFTGATSAWSPGENLYRLLLSDADEEFNRDDAQGFWEFAANNGKQLSGDAYYVMNFADGAVAVWNEVADQL